MDNKIIFSMIGVGNGRVTNDKFCLSRFAQLQLSWSRRSKTLIGISDDSELYPPPFNHQNGGGTHGTSPSEVAESTLFYSPAQRLDPLGSGLPTPVAGKPDQPEPPGFNLNFPRPKKGAS